MSREKPLAVDYSQENSTAQIVPNPPLLTSYESGWSGIHLAHHRQPSWELPELSGSQHIIVLPTPRQTANVEFWSEGDLHCLQYHPNDSANGFIEIFPANLPYKCSWDVEVEFIHYYLEPEFLANVAYESVNPDKVELVLELRKADFLIYHICLALKTTLEIDGANSSFYAELMATALSTHLLQHYSTRKHVLPEHKSGLSKLKLNQAFEYMNEHLTSENLSLAKISDYLGISKHHFCRLFKQSTGLSPHKYLIQQRLERAKQLLTKQELTITQVAIECEFANPSHFAKYFYRYTGLTPKQFRGK